MATKKHCLIINRQQIQLYLSSFWSQNVLLLLIIIYYCNWFKSRIVTIFFIFFCSYLERIIGVRSHIKNNNNVRSLFYVLKHITLYFMQHLYMSSKPKVTLTENHYKTTTGANSIQIVTWNDWSECPFRNTLT